MEFRPLGRTGLKVSACCLGTMTWGEQNSEAEGHAQMDEACRARRQFLRHRRIIRDPAQARDARLDERIIGSWFAKTGKRKEIILATKIVGRTAMDWFRDDKAPARQTRAQIDFAVERSLRNLQTDYIDLYQLHWPDRPIPVFGGHVYKDYPEDFEPFEAILEALDTHIRKGNIRFIGVSNESSWGVMRFLAESEANGLPRMASIQNAYNLVNRTFEIGLAEIAMREHVGLLAYSPLAQGYLSGKYRHGALPKGSRKAMFNRLGRYEAGSGVRMIDAYCDLAAQFGLRPETLALKFCDTRAFMTATIIGATTLEQLRIDIDAFDAPWTEDMEKAVTVCMKAAPTPVRDARWTAQRLVC
jgi:Predicted oxidoreductases (related to aryl-alcohol dehydrogenases)